MNFNEINTTIRRENIVKFLEREVSKRKIVYSNLERGANYRTKTNLLGNLIKLVDVLKKENPDFQFEIKQNQLIVRENGS